MHIQWILCKSPVSCEFLTYKATRDLCDNVAPEEGAVDHPHCLRVPRELCSLKKGRNTMIVITNLSFFCLFHCAGGHGICSHHKYFLVAFVDSVVVNHADNGNTQVASDAKRDAEPQARQDGDDVPSGQAKTGTVHHGKLLLLHQLRTPLCRQLDGFSIGLPLFNQPEKRKMWKCTIIFLFFVRQSGICIKKIKGTEKGHS